jgi:hypothetical protein
VTAPPVVPIRHPEDVECPDCGQPAGWPCRDPWDHDVVMPHRDRQIAVSDPRRVP